MNSYGKQKINKVAKPAALVSIISIHDFHRCQPLKCFFERTDVAIYSKSSIQHTLILLRTNMAPCAFYLGKKQKQSETINMNIQKAILGN
jgi:hypothetical protein